MYSRDLEKMHFRTIAIYHEVSTNILQKYVCYYQRIYEIFGEQRNYD